MNITAIVVFLILAVALVWVDELGKQDRQTTIYARRQKERGII